MSRSAIVGIRKFMSDLGLAAYIIPSADPHQSEYVPECWRRRAFIGGFTGSAGDLVITAEKAGLWTDSRYYLQAEEQLFGTDIDLFKSGLADTPSIPDWLARVLTKGDAVGIDPQLFSKNAFFKLSQQLEPAGIEIRCIPENPVDAIWADRPPLPLGPAVPHPDELSGESLCNRLSRIRMKMRAMKADVLLVTTLDASAWAFNIRGTDVQYNPVVIGYAAIEHDTAVLFIDKRKAGKPLIDHLDGLVEIREYDSFETYLRDLAKTKHAVAVDPETISRWAVDLLRGSCSLIYKRSPIVDLKAEKNDTELDGIARAHVRDGAAMVKFLAWLESAVAMEKITEISAASRLEAFRRLGERYIGPSFGTISAFGPHGAVVHYEAAPKTDAVLKTSGIYLIDSGAQYLDGTTDITRTIALGAPTSEQRDRFTRVLKGHINLAAASFPSGTTGSQLDTIARKPLWDAGLNYGHGTGHGVGAYLNVHEGPHAISYYRGMDVPLIKGMVLSDEPGYYKENEWGIRIENLVQVVQNDDLSTKSAPFLGFKILTLCPIDLRLVNPIMLRDDEITFLNNYHQRVLVTLGPLLDDASIQWLRRATQKIKQ